MNSDDEIILEWHREFQRLDQHWEGKSRACPKCNREFTSRFNRGQCPDCRSIFFASNPTFGNQWIFAVPGLNHPHANLPEPESRDVFDVTLMLNYAMTEIDRFAHTHKRETFYAFAIDANMLCLNSQEAFQESLDRYRAKFPGDYETESEINELRCNTGDWEYQGFAKLSPENGFADDLYDDHYDLGLDGDENALMSTAYAVAMDELLLRLREVNPFRALRTTPDFSTTRVEHNY